MQHRRDVSRAAKSDGSPKIRRAHRARKHPRWRAFGIGLFTLALLLTGGRLLLPGFVRDYVNRTLDRNPNYNGTIGQVQIHLWRGAYSIHEISISKTSGNVPVPFFAARRLDFALQWNALLHHRIVGRLLMEQPEMNFVDGGTEGETQTGAGGPWLGMIRDLFPFQINSARIKDGSIHFRTFKKQR